MAHTLAPAGEIAGPDEFEAEVDLFGLELDGLGDVAVRPAKRGPGRPKGSPNRTTLQLARLLRARNYRDPAEFLAALVTMDTRELVKSIGGEDPEKVLNIQRAAAADLMPYFHQRLPAVAEEQKEEARTLIVMGDLVAQKSVIDQVLGGSRRDASHGRASHETAIDQSYQGVDDGLPHD